MAAIMEDGKLRFGSTNEIEQVNERLKRKYGRGTFIDAHTQTSDGAIFIRLNTATPKDVSDCRDRDRVLKFIEYESIYTLEAEPIGNGYVIDLPDRNVIYQGFKEAKAKLALRLDQTMARAIYRDLVRFTPVKNQLGAIRSILRTVREEGPLSLETIHEIRGPEPAERDKTNQYIQLLEDTDFLRVEGDDFSSNDTFIDTRHLESREKLVVRAGENLDAHDVQEIGTEQFDEIVLGQVVGKAFSTLRDELNMTLLAHYPKYANSYYFTAIERDDPTVRLDVEAARQNLTSLYNEDPHEITVKQKLDDLVEVEVLQRDDEYYYSNDNVYQRVVESPMA